MKIKLLINVLILVTLFSCTEKVVRKINYNVNFINTNDVAHLYIDTLLSQFKVNCDTSLLIPKIFLIRNDNKDTFKIYIEYESNIMKSILPLDAEGISDKYLDSDIYICSKGKRIKPNELEEYFKSDTIASSIFKVNTLFKTYILNLNNSVIVDTNSKIIHVNNLNEFKSKIDEDICNNNISENINLYIINDKNQSYQHGEILLNIESSLDKNNIKDLQVGSYMDSLNEMINKGIENWLLYYLRARLTCKNKGIGFEDSAVQDLASAATFAIDSKYEDTLLNKIINYKSLEFEPLFINEELYKARLEGTLAGLQSKNKDLIDVPLYFLSKHPIRDFTKNIPMIHFEKNNTKRPYLSKGLMNEILIRVKSFNNESGIVVLSVTNQKDKSIIGDISLAPGEHYKIEFFSGDNSYYITNISNLKKPFLTLALDKVPVKNFNSDDIWIDDKISILNKKYINANNQCEQTRYDIIKIKLGGYRGRVLNNDIKKKIENEINNVIQNCNSF